jgi:hypothetical protein
LQNSNTFTRVAIDPSNPMIAYFGSRFGGISKTIDGGTTFNATNFFNEVDRIVIDPTTPTTLYICSGTSGVFQSINGLNSFSTTNFPATASCTDLVLEQSSPAKLVATTQTNGVYSYDGSTGMWSQFPDPFLMSHTLTALARDPTTNIYAGTNGAGAAKSTTSGLSWAQMSTGMQSGVIVDVLPDPGNAMSYYLGAFGAGVYHSADKGATWAATGAQPGSLTIQAMAIAPSAPATLYLATQAPNGFGQSPGFVSTTSGAGWTPWMNSPNGQINTLTVHPTLPMTVFAGTQNGVSFSTDGGTTWVPSNGVFNNTTQVTIVTSNPMMIWAATSNGTYLSIDGGVNFATQKLGQSVNIQTVAVTPSNPMVVFAGGTGITYKTTDGGNSSWVTSDTYNNQVSSSALRIDPLAVSNVFLGLEGLGIMRSSNAGTSWMPASSGIANNYVLDVALDNVTSGTALAGTYGGGLYKTTTGGL